MHQFINLYQPALSHQPDILPARTIAIIIGISVILLTACLVYGQKVVAGLQITSRDLDMVYSQLETHLASSEYDATQHSDDLSAEELSLLQSQVGLRRTLVQQIDELAVDSGMSFGDIFEALAKQNIQGLWLTGVHLHNDGSIEISGKALEPALVPRYLDMISQQSSLKSLNAGTVNISRRENNHADIDFVLSYIKADVLQ